MELVSLFMGWLTFYMTVFCLFPIGLCLDWHKRGTSDGFSAINLVISTFTMACWLVYGFLTDDPMQKYTNGICVVLFSGYLLCYDFYQPNKKTLHYQLLVGAVSLFTICIYVNTLPHKQAVDTMGTIAGTIQAVSIGGVIYEMMRAVKMKTTEYIPASMTFGSGLLGLQFFVLGIVTGDSYIAISNLPLIIVTVAMIALYKVYPPRTWTVPVIGTTSAEEEKKQE